MEKTVRHTIRRLEKNGDKVVNMKVIFQELALNVIGECAFGVEIGDSEKERSILC